MRFYWIVLFSIFSLYAGGLKHSIGISGTDGNQYFTLWGKQLYKGLARIWEKSKNDHTWSFWRKSDGIASTWYEKGDTLWRTTISENVNATEWDDPFFYMLSYSVDSAFTWIEFGRVNSGMRILEDSKGRMFFFDNSFGDMLANGKLYTPENTDYLDSLKSWIPGAPEEYYNLLIDQSGITQYENTIYRIHGNNLIAFNLEGWHETVASIPASLGNSFEGFCDSKDICWILNNDENVFAISKDKGVNWKSYEVNLNAKLGERISSFAGNTILSISGEDDYTVDENGKMTLFTEGLEAVQISRYHKTAKGEAVVFGGSFSRFRDNGQKEWEQIVYDKSDSNLKYSTSQFRLMLNDTLWSATRENGLGYSVDLGRTWTQKGTWSEFLSNEMSSYFIHCSFSWHQGTWIIGYGNPYISIDSGQTWEKLSETLNNRPQRTWRNEFCASNEKGFYCTEDNGLNWKKFSHISADDTRRQVGYLSAANKVGNFIAGRNELWYSPGPMDEFTKMPGINKNMLLISSENFIFGQNDNTYSAKLQSLRVMRNIAEGWLETNLPNEFRFNHAYEYGDSVFVSTLGGMVYALPKSTLVWDGSTRIPFSTPNANLDIHISNRLLHISADQEFKGRLKIVDLQGKQVFLGTVDNGFSLDMTTWKAGRYFLSVENSETKGYQAKSFSLVR